MASIREAYLLAADSTAALVREPEVAAAWDTPSALADLTVGGLAAHLAAQVLFVPRALALDAGELEVVALLEHYNRVRWIGTGLDHEVNVGIRRSGEQTAAEGIDALTADLTAAITSLRTDLPVEPADRTVRPPAGPWALTLDDFLITRMMEIAVHSDDLAHSVSVDTPVLPAAVLDPVLSLLANLAVRRHGQPAVLRALSRSERAPATITAF
jgi:hypothetical protein